MSVWCCLVQPQWGSKALTHSPASLHVPHSPMVPPSPPPVPQGYGEQGTRMPHSDVAAGLRSFSPCLPLPHLPHSTGRGLCVKEGTLPACVTTPATMSLSPFHCPCPAPQRSPSPSHHAQEGCRVHSAFPSPSPLSVWDFHRGTGTLCCPGMVAVTGLQLVSKERSWGAQPPLGVHSTDSRMHPRVSPWDPALSSPRGLVPSNQGSGTFPSPSAHPCISSVAQHCDAWDAGAGEGEQGGGSHAVPGGQDSALTPALFLHLHNCGKQLPT